MLRPSHLRVILTVAVCAAIGCEREPRATDSTAVRAGATPPGGQRAATYTSVEAIDARVDSIRRYVERNPGAVEMYAQVADNAVLVPVKDSTGWPDDVESSFNIVRDSTGAVILHREIPTSESGDWFATRSHFFAPDGRTLFYEFEISSFSSGCGEILRESRQIHYDPAFTILEESRKYTDGDGKPVDAANCYRRSDDMLPPKARNAELPGGKARR